MGLNCSLVQGLFDAKIYAQTETRGIFTFGVSAQLLALPSRMRKRKDLKIVIVNRFV